MVNKVNHPQMAELFRLVNYYNLPRHIVLFSNMFNPILMMIQMNIYIYTCLSRVETVKPPAKRNPKGYFDMFSRGRKKGARSCEIDVMILRQKERSYM